MTASSDAHDERRNPAQWSIDAMKRIETILILVTSVVWMGGCFRTNSSVERSLYSDARRLPNLLRNDAFDTKEFGNSVGRRIVQLQDPSSARRFLLKFEGDVRDFQITATNFNGRKRQLAALRSVLGWIGHGIGENGGPEEWTWEIRILGLEAMRKEIEWARSSGQAKDEWHEQGRGPLLFATGVTGEMYAQSLQDDYDLAVRRLEEAFNAATIQETSPGRADSIRMCFEKTFGRPIRTDEEIKRDRERKIEEAHRRKDKPRGNDVKVDIDSL